jgi:transposase
MEVVHARCAGLDISKKDAKVCVRIAGSGRRKTTETVTTWGSMTNQVLALREHLVAARVTCAVMEATGDYWKPFYYLLEDAGFELMLVNARHVKNLPGRKSDVSDATWLAQLGAHGLVRGSFVPPEPVRQLRELTRARTAITRDAAARSNAWRSCWRTPGSSCPRSPPTSPGCPGGRCCARWWKGNVTPWCWPTWPGVGCGRRSRR